MLIKDQKNLLKLERSFLSFLFPWYELKWKWSLIKKYSEVVSDIGTFPLKKNIPLLLDIFDKNPT